MQQDEQANVKQWIERLKNKDSVIQTDVRETFEYVAQHPGWTFEYIRPGHYNLTHKNSAGSVLRAYGLNSEWIFNQDTRMVEVVQELLAGKSVPENLRVSLPFRGGA